eukprot:m.20570 g.20570  ORF g.20570 m.20570 type:complete len:605 (+) comp12508_c0_seq1:199-2013(+)
MEAWNQAVQADDVEAVKKLLENGLHVNNLNGRSFCTFPPLISAMQSRARSIFDFLLQHPAIDVQQTHLGCTALGFCPTVEYAQLLLERNAQINPEHTVAQCDTSPLHFHCGLQFSNAEMVNFLLELGADVNSTNSRGFTPLHFAVSLDIAEALLSAGAKVNAVSKPGDTPLYQLLKRATCDYYLYPLRVEASDVEPMVLLYLKHGALANGPASHPHLAPLFGNQQFPSVPIMRALKQHGADPRVVHNGKPVFLTPRKDFRNLLITYGVDEFSDEEIQQMFRYRCSQPGIRDLKCFWDLLSQANRTALIPLDDCLWDCVRVGLRANAAFCQRRGGSFPICKMDQKQIAQAFHVGVQSSRLANATITQLGPSVSVKKRHVALWRHIPFHTRPAVLLNSLLTIKPRPCLKGVLSHYAVLQPSALVSLLRHKAFRHLTDEEVDKVIQNNSCQDRYAYLLKAYKLACNSPPNTLVDSPFRSVAAGTNSFHLLFLMNPLPSLSAFLQIFHLGARVSEHSRTIAPPDVIGQAIHGRRRGRLWKHRRKLVTDLALPWSCSRNRYYNHAFQRAIGCFYLVIRRLGQQGCVPELPPELQEYICSFLLQRNFRST